MGSDNIFHKRKQNAAATAQRRKASRQPYDKVLIVCEGEKTEPLYFKELIDHYEIHTANVRISGQCGSDPVSVVNHSIQLYQDEQCSPSESFDRVYCVFDRDAHANYQQALDKIKQTKPDNTFFAIPSVPCFEYWLLLHFNYTTAPYTSVDSVSAGDAVVKELRKYWPEYQKGSRDTFNYTFNLQKDELASAKQNAVRSLAQAQQNHTDNPSTTIYLVVDYLQKIK